MMTTTTWPLLLLVIGLAESGSHHASIKSKYGQLVTSSTMRWTHSNSNSGVNNFPKEAVPSGTGNADKFVCRAEHHGALLAGQTTEIGSYCVVGFINRLYKKHKYELLINVDRAARLEWRPYSKYAGVPEGSVAAVDESSASVVGENDIFIGRYLNSATSSWLPGAVEVPRRSSSFGVMRVFDSKGNMSEHIAGDILVEVEPTRYDLELHDSLPEDQPRRPKKTTRSDVVLAKSSLFRFDEGKDVEARLQKVLSYDYEKSEYYGQVPGMIRALPTTIRLPNGQVQSILWGLPEKSTQHETLMVGNSLKHYRAVDVSVVGVRITEEAPYKATLTAIFPDGSRRQRTIDGVAQRIYLNNIRPEYSIVYQIKESVQSSQLTTTTATTSTLGPEEHPSTKDSFQYRYRDNELRDGQKSRQTKDRMLSDEETGLDQQQQLLLASQSTAASTRPSSCFVCLFSLIIASLLLLPPSAFRICF